MGMKGSDRGSGGGYWRQQGKNSGGWWGGVGGGAMKSTVSVDVSIPLDKQRNKR